MSCSNLMSPSCISGERVADRPCANFSYFAERRAGKIAGRCAVFASWPRNRSLATAPARQALRHISESAIDDKVQTPPWSYLLGNGSAIRGAGPQSTQPTAPRVHSIRIDADKGGRIGAIADGIRLEHRSPGGSAGLYSNRIRATLVTEVIIERPAAASPAKIAAT